MSDEKSRVEKHSPSNEELKPEEAQRLFDKAEDFLDNFLFSDETEIPANKAEYIIQGALDKLKEGGYRPLAKELSKQYRETLQIKSSLDLSNQIEELTRHMNVNIQETTNLKKQMMEMIEVQGKEQTSLIQSLQHIVGERSPIVSAINNLPNKI